MSTATLSTQAIAKDHEIDEVDRIDPQVFLRDYVRTNRPLLTHEMTRDWPAMEKWSFEFFSKLSLNKQVYLEQDNVMQGEAAYSVQSYADSLRAIIEDDGSGSQKAGYLSVFKIFRAFPELEQDVDFSLLAQHQVKSTGAGWIGPAGTVTGYHIDWGDNLLAQIVGRKQVHLVSPADSKYMYPTNRFDQGTRSSAIDAEKWDEAKHPLYRNATVHKLVLNPGDMLFIPRGWWHQVKSLDKSISVSSIGYNVRGLFEDLLSHRVLQWLHDAGVYNVPCTCHIMQDGKRVRRSVAN